MASRVQDYREKFASRLIRFNPYTVKKMNLLQSQTMLQLEDYMLICAPYQLSMKRVVLLVILSRDEIIFFQRFQNKSASLTISFQKPGIKAPINFFIRGILARMGPVKGKNNVCMMDISYKTCPDELAEIIGDYILAYQSLRGQYENFKNRTVEIDQKKAQTLRYNNYVETQIGTQKVQTRLHSLAVNRLILEVPPAFKDLKQGQKLVSKLFFQTYQFLSNGEITDIDEQSGGAKRVTVDIAFSPELVEIMDDYFFRMSFKKN